MSQLSLRARIAIEHARDFRDAEASHRDGKPRQRRSFITPLKGLHDFATQCLLLFSISENAEILHFESENYFSRSQ